MSRLRARIVFRLANRQAPSPTYILVDSRNTLRIFITTIILLSISSNVLFLILCFVLLRYFMPVNMYYRCNKDIIFDMLSDIYLIE